MAITTQNLFEALRLGTGADIPAALATILTRQLGVATALVEQYAPDAPDAVKDEAVVRIAAWLYDSPAVQSATRAPFVNSGAASLLSSYRARQALTVA